MSLEGRIRLVALDVDGTVLGEDGQIPQATREAVAWLRRRGVLVTLCTGRRIASALQVARALDLECPLVVHGGAVVVEPTGRLLWRRLMSTSASRHLVEACCQEGLDLIAYGDPRPGREVIYHLGRRAADLIRRYYTSPPPDLVLPWEGRGRGDRMLRAMAVGPAPAAQALVARCSPQELRWIVWPTPEDTFVEFGPCGCSKATGLRWLARRLGVDPDQIAAFGDNLNDVEMFEYVGYAVAMGSAPEEVRSRAHRVLEDGPGGLGRVLRELAAG